MEGGVHHGANLWNSHMVGDTAEKFPRVCSLIVRAWFPVFPIFLSFLSSGSNPQLLWWGGGSSLRRSLADSLTHALPRLLHGTSLRADLATSCSWVLSCSLLEQGRARHGVGSRVPAGVGYSLGSPAPTGMWSWPSTGRS